MQIPEPTFAQKMKHLGKDLVKLVHFPETVTDEHYVARMEVCGPCKFRKENKCLACGCNVHLKGLAATWTCDVGYWKEVDEEYGLDPDDIEEEHKPEPTEPHKHTKRNVYVGDQGEVKIREASGVKPPEGYALASTKMVGDHNWQIWLPDKEGVPLCRHRRTDSRVKDKSTTVQPICLVDGDAKKITLDTCVGCPLAELAAKPTLMNLPKLTKAEKERWDVIEMMPVKTAEDLLWQSKLIEKHTTEG
jgi:hypothetical protein